MKRASNLCRVDVDWVVAAVVRVVAAVVGKISIYEDHLSNLLM